MLQSVCAVPNLKFTINSFLWLHSSPTISSLTSGQFPGFPRTAVKFLEHFRAYQKSDHPIITPYTSTTSSRRLPDEISPWHVSWGGMSQRNRHNGISSYVAREDARYWRRFSYLAVSPIISASTVLQYIGRKYRRHSGCSQQASAATRPVSLVSSLHWHCTQNIHTTQSCTAGMWNDTNSRAATDILTKIRNFRDLRTCQKGPKSDQKVT